MELFGMLHFIWILLTLVTGGIGVRELGCKRRPLHSTLSPSVSNGEFKLDVPQLSSSSYLPEQQYEVTLESKKDRTFTAFMVWPEEKSDPLNPYRIVGKDVGAMHIYPDQPVKLSEVCINTIENINAANINSVKMYWKSPPRGSGCVTLHAMVAENDDVYYKDDSGLTVDACEDDSLSDDKYSLHEGCAVSEDAKYELIFEGKWSRNTHPYKFPADDFSVYYGDMIGASHSPEYTMWKDGSDPSEAMTQLALTDNTTLLEHEILTNGNTRTLIKGKGHGRMYGKLSDATYALVRLDKKHHLISTAIMLRPSPDWFLGVPKLELCQKNDTWLPSKTINLIPWDAGVNEGISFESPKVRSYDRISRVKVGSFDSESPFYNMNYKQVKPFATLTVRLIQTYPSMCEEQEWIDVEQTFPEDRPSLDFVKVQQPEAPSRQIFSLAQSKEGSSIREENDLPASINENADDDCPLSEWEEWTPCSGQCGESGYRFRSRSHIVNGVEYRYHKPDEKIPSKITEPSDECVRRREDDRIETEPCINDCSYGLQAQSYRVGEPNSRPRRAGMGTYEGRQSQIANGVSGVNDSGGVEADSRPQNCVMSSWSLWGACSGSCGEGRRQRTRSIITKSRNGGLSCPTTKLEVQTCNLDPCYPNIP